MRDVVCWHRAFFFMKQTSQVLNGAHMDRLVLGFVIGVGIGVAYVVWNAPQSGTETRDDFALRLQRAQRAASKAAAAREQELWGLLRNNLSSNAHAEGLLGPIDAQLERARTRLAE
jgi:gas vesicle protein